MSARILSGSPKADSIEVDNSSEAIVNRGRQYRQLVTQYKSIWRNTSSSTSSERLQMGIELFKRLEDLADEGIPIEDDRHFFCVPNAQQMERKLYKRKSVAADKAENTNRHLASPAEIDEQRIIDLTIRLSKDAFGQTIITDKQKKTPNHNSAQSEMKERSAHSCFQPKGYTPSGYDSLDFNVNTAADQGIIKKKKPNPYSTQTDWQELSAHSLFQPNSYYTLLGEYGRISLGLDFNVEDAHSEEPQVSIANIDQRNKNLSRLKEVYELLKQKGSVQDIMTPVQIEYRALWSQYNPCSLCTWITSEESRRGKIDHAKSKLLYHELTVEFPIRNPDFKIAPPDLTPQERTQFTMQHVGLYTTVPAPITPERKFEQGLQLTFAAPFLPHNLLSAQKFLSDFTEQHPNLKAAVTSISFDALEKTFMRVNNLESLITGQFELVIARLEGMAKGNAILEARVAKLNSSELQKFLALVSTHLKNPQDQIAQSDLEQFLQAHADFHGHMEIFRKDLEEAQRVKADFAKRQKIDEVIEEA